MGCVYASAIGVSPDTSTCHALLVLRQVKFSTRQFHRKREVNERLCIEEVGVDPEPHVHPHGYDVELIMKTSCKNDYPLGINLSCVYDLPFYPRVLPL